MKIKQLIEQLQKLPGDLNVYVDGHEDGITDLESVGEVYDVALNVYDEWYYGKHQITDSDLPFPGKEKARGIVLSRFL